MKNNTFHYHSAKKIPESPRFNCLPNPLPKTVADRIFLPLVQKEIMLNQYKFIRGGT